MANIDTVIRFLLKQNDNVDAKTIAENCNISLRSVYNYLNEIKEDSRYTCYVSKKGIRINKVNSEDEDLQIPNTYEKRKQYIINRCLFQSAKLNIYELEEYFSISSSTMHSMIIRLRKELMKYHIKLITKNGLIYLNGDSDSINRYKRQAIYSNNEGAMVSVESLKEMFPDLDIGGMRNIIKESLQKRNLFMDEYSLINLLIHLIIGVEAGQICAEKDDDYPVEGLVQEICDRVYGLYGYRYSRNTMRQLSIIADTRIINRVPNNLSDRVKKEYIYITNLIISKLHDVYDLDFDNDEFRYPFALHVENLTERIINGSNLVNPLLSNIKINSPITYDIAVFIADIISKAIRMPISESEIAYIALHVGAKVEQIKNEKDKIRTVIVCPVYFAYNSNLREIENLYKDVLFIRDVVTSFDDIASDDNIDLIISTEKANKPYSCRIVYVSNFLNITDKKTIAQATEEINSDNRRKENMNIIKQLFKKDLFMIVDGFENKNEAIDIMAENMASKGYVSSRFAEQIYRREAMAPTDFKNIAIPHPSEYFEKETCISVAILHRPLNWGKNNICIIFMMAVNKSDVIKFENIFSSLISIYSDREKAQKTLEVPDYDSFLQLLSKQIEGEE